MKQQIALNKLRTNFRYEAQNSLVATFSHIGVISNFKLLKGVQ